MRKTVLVIPAYNEAENIVSVIAEVRALDLRLDIVVVDDGSTDATAALARQSGVRVISLPFNLGYGAAVETGLQHAARMGYECCVLLDGDGQHDPGFIADLLAPVVGGEADLALGSRFLGRATYRLPWGRRLGMRMFSVLVSWLTGQRITDPTSGFQAMGRGVINYFVQDNYPYDFPDADTLLRLHRAGFRIREVPVNIRARLRGQSMHGLGSAFYYLYKMFFSIFIVLTERHAQRGGTDAASNQNSDRRGQSDGVADHRATGASKTAR